METPKCKDCNQPMFEIGGIGKEIQICDNNFKVIGVREQKLYQCPECKEVKID